MERKWSIRKYKEQDKEGILNLFREVYPNSDYHLQHLTDWYRWKYEDNPAGVGVICLAEHDGKIVGSDAKIPVIAKLGTETVTICQSVESMTHHDYRHQGIYMALQTRARREMKERDIDIVFGFPSKQAYLIDIEKLEYFGVVRMPAIFRPFNWGNVLRLQLNNKFLLKFGSIVGQLLQILLYRARKLPVIERLTVAKITHFDERIDDFWQRVSSQHQIAIERTKDYLNWRYSTPGIDYSKYIAEKDGRVQGYVVSRCMPRANVKAGIIFDMLSESEEIAQYLVSKTVEDCKRQDVDIIYAGMIANKIYLKALRNNGFLRLPFIKLVPLVIYSTSQHFSTEFLKEEKNWLVQIGDSDVI